MNGAKSNGTDRVHLEPVTEVTWLENLALAWDHKDPADRTIAFRYSCLLYTSRCV